MNAIVGDLNDPQPVETLLPATQKQLVYARQIATRIGCDVPDALVEDRRALSRWIDQQKAKVQPAQGFEAYPSSKQVGFAEAIARRKRCDVPPECFKDRQLLSRWIDCNK